MNWKRVKRHYSEVSMFHNGKRAKSNYLIANRAKSNFDDGEITNFSSRGCRGLARID